MPMLTKNGIGKPVQHVKPELISSQRYPIQLSTSSLSGAATLMTQQLTNLHKNQWYVLSLISLASTAGIYAEKTKIGEMLSGPLITMVFGLIACNTGLLPTSSVIYDTVLKYFVPLAIAFLLYDADLKKCFKVTGKLLTIFLIGSLGTVLGTFGAYWLIPMKTMNGGKKIAAALCARHIGGAVNFVALSDIIKIDPEIVAAALAADNLIVAFFFSFLFLIAPPFNSSSPANNTSAASATVTDENVNSIVEKKIQAPVNLSNLSLSITIAVLLTAASKALSSLTVLSPMIITSTITVGLATLFPRLFEQLQPSSGILGLLFMQYFFAATGAMGHIPTVIKVAPMLLVHTLIQIVIHFGFTHFVGRAMKFSIQEIALASNANVGGPTTAAAMAMNKNWKALILPGLLTGVIGLAIATQIGLVVYKVLLRL
eukprot:gene4842-5197_t